MSENENYPYLVWRPFFDIFSSYAVIGISIGLTRWWWGHYPLTTLIIANRILALVLLSHEGLHGTLARNQTVNNFLGRWFCAFPAVISFSRYRKLHLLHHRALGHKSYDPDFGLYKDYPQSGSAYLFRNIRMVLSLTTLWRFLQYYTDVPDFVFSRGRVRTQFKQMFMQGDFVPFLVFHLSLLLILIFTGMLKMYLVFFLVPWILVTQPYVLMMGGLQHGPLPESKRPELLSRSIRGPWWLMWLVLPVNINFHSEHHYNSSIPHYWLRQFADDLQEQGVVVWKANYWTAIQEMYGGSKCGKLRFPLRLP